MAAAGTPGSAVSGREKQISWLGESWRFYRDDFLLGFCRYVPLLASLLILMGLLLRQLGEHFGVPNLIDFRDPWRQLGGGFALMLVCLQCLYLGYLFNRAVRRDAGKSTKWPFWKYALFVMVCLLGSLILLGLLLGQHSFILVSTEVVLTLVQDYPFCIGMLLAVGVYLLAAFIGHRLWQYFHKRPQPSWVETLRSTPRMQPSHTEFVTGALILVGYFVFVALVVTYLAWLTGRTWTMYVAALLFVLLFLRAVLSGPHLIRFSVLRATGADGLYRSPEGAPAIWTCLSLFVLGESLLTFVSLSSLRVGSPITTVCALWLGLLICYMLFRKIVSSAPVIVAVGMCVLLLLGASNPYKYRFEPDLSYPVEVIDLFVVADQDRQRQQDYDDMSQKLNDVLHSHEDQQGESSARPIHSLASLEAEVERLRIELLNKNRVIPPRAPRKTDEEYDHQLLDIRDLEFDPVDVNERNEEFRPLVLVAVSGGGLRSAAWTYRILKLLEVKLAEEGIDFASHVRVICGASGGMLGAAYYVANLEDVNRRTELVREIQRSPDATTLDDPYYELLAGDCLTPVINTMVFHDVPWLCSPFNSHTDRGVVLQDTWMRVPGRGGGFPLRTTFAELRDKERQGHIPSLVFTPMMVEDGRRLLISNLDLRWVATNGGNRLGMNPFSAEAIELFRLLPKSQNNFRLATAARMSASFPYVSPPAVLPTTPRRRVVDAGYYDNYGVSLAASWLFGRYHQDALQEKGIRRVLLIQIRDGLSDPHRKLEYISADNTNQLVRASEEITTPLTGFYNGQNSSSSFRNDGLLEVLSHYYREKKQRTMADAPNFQVKSEDEFFMTLTLEYSGNASLSWYLTPEERESIKRASAFLAECEEEEGELNRQEGELLDRVRQQGQYGLTEIERADLDAITSKRVSRRIRALIDWWSNDLSSLRSEESSLTDVTPRAKVSTEGISEELRNAGYRRFTMWVELPESEREDVEKVTYFMNHPSFNRPLLVGVPGEDRTFEASYIGYGALSKVLVTIKKKDGTTRQIEFNQHLATFSEN